jgi:hypothetical protein
VRPRHADRRRSLRPHPAAGAFFVVDGLEGGHAVIQKLHHTVADGEGSLRLSMQFIDLTRDAEDPPMPPVPESGGAEPAAPPSALETVRDVVTGGLRMPIGISRQYRDLLADPTQIPTAGATLARTVKGVISQLSDVEAAHSPVWTQRSLKRRLETLRSPLDRPRRRPEAGRHPQHGVHPAPPPRRRAITTAPSAHQSSMRASMAISTRTKGPARTRSRSLRLVVPTGEMDMAERFRLIHEATTTAREASATAGAGDHRRSRLRAAHVARDPAGQVPGPDGRLRHLERPCRGLPVLHRRRGSSPTTPWVRWPAWRST